MTSNYSLRSKEDDKTGLVKTFSNEKQITTRSNFIFVDSRDCIGEQSLYDAQNYFKSIGLRSSISGRIESILDTSPITVNIYGTCEQYRLKNGDKVKISGVGHRSQDNLGPLGSLGTIGSRASTNMFESRIHTITEAVGSSFKLFGTFGSGFFEGQGTWVRESDPGLPEITQNSNTIIGSTMSINLVNKLRLIKSFSLVNVIMPRDIIPLISYLPDFIDKTTVPVPDAYIQQNKKFLETQMLGFYSTPLELYRTYINGAYSMPKLITPGPLQLWNPPVGPWPLNSEPYPFQTIPTYRSNTFSVNGNTGYHLILSGLGVYDLNDFSTELQISVPFAPFIIDIGPIITEIARKLLLLLIVQQQSYGPINEQVDYVDLIFNSNSVEPGNTVFPYGYGSFQRFIPGPGLQLNYQPGTSDSTDPTVSQTDWPVPFPNFNGNVWGPYDAPGSRFQKLGLMQVTQDLFLNGDLQNLYGDPIIKQDVPISELMSDSTFGLNVELRTVTLANIEESTNLNIINAMKIGPNGFGTTVLTATGNGSFNSTTYQNGGGQGPDVNGVPPGGSAWVNNGLYLTSDSGQGTFNDPIATGPNTFYNSSSITPASDPNSVSAVVVGDEISPTTPMIMNRKAWTVSYKGLYKQNVEMWKNYMLREVNETNIIMTISEAQKDLRAQGTNGVSYGSVFSCPVRLNLGTDTGSLKYMETLSPILGSPNVYWTKNFLSPISSMSSFKIEFSTYDGYKIPLEKMLQERNAINLLRTFERISGSLIGQQELNKLMFNPLNPTLNGRTKRNISLIFDIVNYEYVSPGLELIVENMLNSFDDEDSLNSESSKDFVVQAFNHDYR